MYLCWTLVATYLVRCIRFCGNVNCPLLREAEQSVATTTTTTTTFTNTAISNIEKSCARFFTVSSQHSETSQGCMLTWSIHSHVQITCSTLGTYHMQHAGCCLVLSDSSAVMLIELKPHLFSVLFHRLKPLTKEGTEGSRVPGENPDNKLQKIAILKIPKYSSPSQDLNPCSRCSGRPMLGKQICYPLHHSVADLLSLTPHCSRPAIPYTTLQQTC